VQCLVSDGFEPCPENFKNAQKGQNLRFFATGKANRFDALEAREHGVA
jgi:hypothetical protein